MGPADESRCAGVMHCARPRPRLGTKRRSRLVITPAQVAVGVGPLQARGPWWGLHVLVEFWVSGGVHDSVIGSALLPDLSYPGAQHLLGSVLNGQVAYSSALPGGCATWRILGLGDGVHRGAQQGWPGRGSRVSREAVSTSRDDAGFRVVRQSRERRRQGCPVNRSGQDLMPFTTSDEAPRAWAQYREDAAEMPCPTVS